jgi:hypothetical protein
MAVSSRLGVRVSPGAPADSIVCRVSGGSSRDKIFALSGIDEPETERGLGQSKDGR